MIVDILEKDIKFDGKSINKKLKIDEIIEVIKYNAGYIYGRWNQCNDAAFVLCVDLNTLEAGFISGSRFLQFKGGKAALLFKHCYFNGWGTLHKIGKLSEEQLLYCMKNLPDCSLALKPKEKK